MLSKLQYKTERNGTAMHDRTVSQANKIFFFLSKQKAIGGVVAEMEKEYIYNNQDWECYNGAQGNK